MARFNYVDASVAPSLYRNGAMLTRRNLDGTDDEIVGLEIEEREKPVHDARVLTGPDRCTVERNGFELLVAPVARSDTDFLDHADVLRDYYRECAESVRAATGSSHGFAFDHNVRSAAGKEAKERLRGGQEVQGPGLVVHGDYTLRSGPERLQQLAKPPSINDTYADLVGPGESLIPAALVDRALTPGGRFALINLWRNIAQEPVSSHPLALCDGQTVRAEELVVFEIHYQDRIGENYFARHAPRHAWFYYPEMARDEALLIKQWDSAGSLARSGGEESDGDVSGAPCSFSFHSAFEDPATPPDAPARWSIEVRCAVIYD